MPCLVMAAHNTQPIEGFPNAQTSELDLRGGTDASMAPPVAYVQQVLLPMLRRLQGIEASIDLQKRGFFPKASALCTDLMPGPCDLLYSLACV